MISHKHKCIFIHIPRTGGTSIENHIIGGDYAKINLLEKHLTAEKTIEIYGKDVWNEYFKFSFVRNPWSRIISVYNMSLYNVPKEKLSKIVAPHVKTHKIIGIASGKGLKYFLDNYEPASWEQNPPLFHEILKVPADCKPIDFIGRFENLQEDFKHICSKLQIPLDKLGHINAQSGKKHYSSYYDEETINMVAAKHKTDIEMFDYKFETNFI